MQTNILSTVIAIFGLLNLSGINLNNCKELKQSDHADVIQLSAWEKEIIGYLFRIEANNRITEKLFLSRDTIEAHRKNILSILSLENTAALIKYANENEIV